METNPFENPKKYRDIILMNKFLDFKKKNLNGKSLVCLFLTRFCGVGCPFCFFKSAPPWRKSNIEDQFSDEGIEKFIEFSKKANLGYLLISGGGEPLNQKKHILRLVEAVPTNRIVLVTSGNWAKNYDAALKYIQDLYDAFKKRKILTTLVVRVSISEDHSIKLGTICALNIINIFDKYFKNEKNFVVQIKSFQNDPTITELLAKLPMAILSPKAKKTESDNDVLIKVIPEKYVLTLASGYEIKLGISKIFQATLKPDLNNPTKLKEAIKIFEGDLKYSEDNNSTLVFNNDGKEGLDWSINYNGNICVWQNQVRDTHMNLYEDSYEEILDVYMEDPITYSLIDKGNLYRDKIVSEVNSRAVLRAKAIGLRDASGAIIFEEEKTRLYYAIRVLQDYIIEGKIKEVSIKKWPWEILQLVSFPKEKLIMLHNHSSFNIVAQQKKKIFNKSEWYDFLELLKLAHYDLSQEDIKDALGFYNQHVEKKVYDLSEIEPQIGDVVRRLTERLTHIKPLKRLIDRGKEGESYAVLESNFGK